MQYQKNKNKKIQRKIKKAAGIKNAGSKNNKKKKKKCIN